MYLSCRRLNGKEKEEKREERREKKNERETEERNGRALLLLLNDQKGN